MKLWQIMLVGTLGAGLFGFLKPYSLRIQPSAGIMTVIHPAEFHSVGDVVQIRPQDQALDSDSGVSHGFQVYAQGRDPLAETAIGEIAPLARKDGRQWVRFYLASVKTSKVIAGPFMYDCSTLPAGDDGYYRMINGVWVKLMDSKLAPIPGHFGPVPDYGAVPGQFACELAYEARQ